MRSVETVSFLLPPKVVELVHLAVESGEYGSTSEVVSDALRGWSQNRNVSKQGVEELRNIWLRAINDEQGTSVKGVLDVLERKYQALSGLCSPETERLSSPDIRGAFPHPAKRPQVDTEENTEAILYALRKKVYNPDDFPTSPCVYAVYLREPDALAPIKTISSGLLYLGRTRSSLKGRDHLCYRPTSSFSLRQTLGAVLKRELGLQAIPRRGGATAKDSSDYEFTISGEQRLTDWMVEHLTYGFAAVQHFVQDMAPLLTSLHPALNLTGWKNPQRPLLDKLRRACREEASRAR